MFTAHRHDGFMVEGCKVGGEIHKAINEGIKYVSLLKMEDDSQVGGDQNVQPFIVNQSPSE